jgi:hypothetical protein
MSEAWQELKGNNIDLDPEDRLESQRFQLCAVHAINHLLQEEKIIWEPRIPALYISSSENIDYVDDASHAWTCTCTHKNPSDVAECEECHKKQPAHRSNNRLGHAFNTEAKAEAEAEGGEAKEKDPMNFDTLINIHKYCANKLVDLQGIQTENGKPPPEPQELLNTFQESLCQFTGGHQGMIPFDFIGDILEMVLHHTVIRPQSLDNDTIIDAVQEDDTLGVVLNLGGGHYTTICKYFNTCISDKKRKYAYIDSIYDDNKGGVSCVTASELNQLLTDIADFGQNVYAVLIVKSTPDSYKSTAKARQDSHEFNVPEPENNNNAAEQSNSNNNNTKKNQASAAAAAFNGGGKRKTRTISGKHKTPCSGGKPKTPCSGGKPKTRGRKPNTRGGKRKTRRKQN